MAASVNSATKERLATVNRNTSLLERMDNMIDMLENVSSSYAQMTNSVEKMHRQILESRAELQVSTQSMAKCFGIQPSCFSPTLLTDTPIDTLTPRALVTSRMLDNADVMACDSKQVVEACGPNVGIQANQQFCDQPFPFCDPANQVGKKPHVPNNILMVDTLIKRDAKKKRRKTIKR